MKFELTLTTDYVPDWGLWEGIREIIQNSMDGETDGYPATVAHKGTTLSCSSAGVRLDRNVLLLGTSSKRDNNAYIGKFGEGMVLGILALVRAGHSVRIVNDDEVWTPSIEPSSTFGSKVLTFRTRALPKATGAFTVEVGGVCATYWKFYKERFLHLCPPERVIGETWKDQVLMGPAHIGRLYVKGIFVQELEKFGFGYNLSTVDTDRDRRMVNNWNLRYKISDLWFDICNNFDDLGVTPTEQRAFLDVLFNALNRGDEEFRVMADYAMAHRVGPFVAHFRQAYGDDAIPVMTDSERRDAEHHGINAVLVGGCLARLLREDDSMKLAEACKRAASEITRVHPRGSLTSRELTNLDAALSILEEPLREKGYPDLNQILQIVDFGCADTLGQYDGTGARVVISIARGCLLNLTKILQVLVHEIAHFHGGDGDVRHERAEGELFSAALAHLHYKNRLLVAA